MSLTTLLVDTKEMIMFVELKTKDNKVLAEQISSKVQENPKSDEKERGNMKIQKSKS